MGRYRIKKKETLIPFRQTLAYRLLLITASVVAFIVMLFQMTAALAISNMYAGIAWGVLAALGAVGAFYNLDRARYAKVSEASSKRMKRK